MSSQFVPRHRLWCFDQYVHYAYWQTESFLSTTQSIFNDPCYPINVWRGSSDNDLGSMPCSLSALNQFTLNQTECNAFWMTSLESLNYSAMAHLESRTIWHAENVIDKTPICRAITTNSFQMRIHDGEHIVFANDTQHRIHSRITSLVCRTNGVWCVLFYCCVSWIRADWIINLTIECGRGVCWFCMQVINEELAPSNAS